MNEYERFLNLAKTRRSIRNFAPKKVTREDILRVLEAASWAPSNHNRQPWRFIVLQGRSRLMDLADSVKREVIQRLKLLPQVAAEHAAELAENAAFFSEAPLVIAVLHRKPASFSLDMLRTLDHPELVSGEPLSTAMAVQNLLLAAHSLGLGSCIMTAPLLARDALASRIQIPPGHEINCLIALGHASGSAPTPRRKVVEQIFEFRQDEERSS